MPMHILSRHVNTTQSPFCHSLFLSCHGVVRITSGQDKWWKPSVEEVILGIPAMFCLLYVVSVKNLDKRI